MLINGEKLKAKLIDWEQIGGYNEGELNIIRAVINEIDDALEEGPWIPVTEKSIGRGLMLVKYTDGDIDLLNQPTAYMRGDIVAWIPLKERKASYAGH